MKRAYTLNEAARELGLSVAEARELVTLVFGVPRDLLSLTDLALVREASGEARRQPLPSAITSRLKEAQATLPAGARLTLAKEGRELVAAHGRTRWNVRSGQQLLDFGVRGNTPWLAAAARPDADALFARAVALEATDPAAALTLYLEAVAANAFHADAHVNLGRLYHGQGLLKEAEAHYVAALVARPKDVTALFNLAVALEDLGRLDDAIRRYLEVLAIEPRSVDACFNLARLYEKKGETMAAIRHFKDYRRLTSP